MVGLVKRGDIDHYTVTTEKLIKLIKARLAQVGARIDWSDPIQAAAIIAKAYEALMVSGQAAMSRASLDWYLGLRQADTGEEYAPPVVDRPAFASARAVGETKWAFENYDRLETAVLRAQVVERLGRYGRLHIRNCGRETICRLVDQDPAKPRWARVPKGKTCAWCTMLASRGWVYASPLTAGAVSGSYHSDCDCQIVPSWESGKTRIKGYDPDKYYREYKTAWKQVKAELPKHEYPRDFQVAKRMRRLFPGSYSDGVSRAGMMDCDWFEVIEGLKKEKNAADKIARFKRQYAMASAAADFSNLVYPDGSVDILQSRELDFVERFIRHGERIKWIPRDIVKYRSTNDFHWLTNNGLVCEAKVTNNKYSTIKANIRAAVVSARDNHGVVKDIFMIDLRRYRLTEKLRHNLELYNVRVTDAPIRRLFVLHGEPPELTEIDLK